MDVVNVVLGKVVDLLFAQVGRQISYLSNYKDNVADLRQKIEDLKGARQRMQGKIDVALREGEVIEADVEVWTESVDNITQEVDAFLASEDVAAEKIVCFHLRSRYSSSKKAMRKTSYVRELYEKHDRFPTVARAAPRLGIDANKSVDIDAYESQKSAMKKIMDALEEENVHTIAICGIGGVGKTTLVKELGKRVKGKLFDEVAMTVASQNADEKKIQQNIASMLGVHNLPEDADSRREKLWDRILRGNKVLIIVDDVWKRLVDDVWKILDLEKLGIPFGKHNTSTCKVVLTSRNETDCRDMGAQKVITITPMPEKEAWTLFKHVVMAEDVEIDLDIQQIEGKIFNECRGLPIAIMAVGVALRKETKNDWALVYDNLKIVSPIDNPIIKEVYPVLKTSYTYLKDKEAKSCFMLCSLFTEDEEIPVEWLVQYGMGLKLFQRDENGLQHARRGARTAVNTLKHSHLLLPGKDHDHVKMHDVVRDVAIAIASQDENNMFLVNAGVGRTTWPDKDSFENYTGISLMKNDIRELFVGLKCPKLQILLLQGNESLQTIPDEYFHGMENLRVLDLHHCRISSIPSSLSLLTTLRSLHLNHSKVQDMSSLGALTQLQVLSLSSTRIDRIPEQIRCLTNLRLLDVRHCENLSYIAPRVISNLKKLEDLYIGDSFMEWDMEGEANEIKNASLTELDSLYRLTNLDIIMPDMKMLPKNLQLKSLQRFNITIGGTMESSAVWERYPDCCFLCLTLDIKMPLLGWVKKLMKAAKCLRLNSMSNLNSIIRDLHDVDFNKVRFLQVLKCNDVSCLVDMAGPASTPVFCSLEELRLCELQNFTQICQAQLHPTCGSFSKLKRIAIWDCNKMSTALGSNLLSSLPNLTELKVCRCSSMENIIESWPESCTESVVEELERPEIIHSGRAGSSCLQNLEKVWLFYCHNVKYVFPPLIAKRLSLKSLRVWMCEKVEAIIGAETNRDVTKVAGGIEKMTMFPSLTRADLSHLPSLKSFCSECYNMVEYPSLSRVRILECQNIEVWGYGIQVTPSLKENNIDSDNGSCKMVLKEGVNGTELEIANERLHLPLVSDGT